MSRRPGRTRSCVVEGASSSSSALSLSIVEVVVATVDLVVREPPRCRWRSVCRASLVVAVFVVVEVGAVVIVAVEVVVVPST